jgi:hypothetical protein
MAGNICHLRPCLGCSCFPLWLPYTCKLQDSLVPAKLPCLCSTCTSCVRIMEWLELLFSSSLHATRDLCSFQYLRAARPAAPHLVKQGTTHIM